jgi:hypothetical protein
MKNSLLDLHNNIFAMLEKLNDETQDVETAKLNVMQALAMSKLASNITANMAMLLKAKEAGKEKVALPVFAGTLPSPE